MYINKMIGYGFFLMVFYYLLLIYLYIILFFFIWKVGEYVKEKNIIIFILVVEGERIGLEKVSKCVEIFGGIINVFNFLEIFR